MTKMSFANHSAHAPGWSAHELALFHRTADFLSTEGISVETDYGLTDEGDPWLVFCDAESGEVFGHFARFHDQYVACMPFRNDGLSGWVLTDLLSRYLRLRGVGWSTVARARSMQGLDTLAAVGFLMLQCA